MKNSDAKRPIWAPWRIDFIRSEKDNKCFLCNKQNNSNNSANYAESNEEDEKIVLYKGEHIFIILNRYPYNPGHLLLSPYRHISDISYLTKEERVEIMDLLIVAQDIIKKEMNPDGFNIGFNLGSAAGAGVADHIHMHLVPRWSGDNNFMPVIGNIRVVPESLEATAKILKKYFQKI